MISSVFLIFHSINILHLAYIYINISYEIPYTSFNSNFFQQLLIQLIYSYYHTIYLSLFVLFTDWQFKSDSHDTFWENGSPYSCRKYPLIHVYPQLHSLEQICNPEVLIRRGIRNQWTKFRT